MYMSELYISSIISHCCPHKPSHLHTHSHSHTPLPSPSHSLTRSTYYTIEIVVEELDHINEERDRDDQTQTEGEKSLSQQGTVCVHVYIIALFFHEDVTICKSHYDCRCVCVFIGAFRLKCGQYCR